MRFPSLRVVVSWSLVLLAAALPRPAGAGPLASDGIRMAPATPGAVRFTVTVPEPALMPSNDGERLTELSLAGYAAEGDPGTPGIPTRTVLVAVPPLGDVRLTAAASELRVSDAVTLAPLPGADREGNRVPFPRRLAAYGVDGSGTPVAARLVNVTWMRNQRVARLEIAPVAYEPAARRLTVAGRVDVELAVANPGPLGPAAEPADPFERVYQLSLLNYEQGRAWRRPRTEALVTAARRAGTTLAALGAAAIPADTTSIFAGRTWIKLSVQKTGFYAINFSRLRGLSLFDPTNPAPLDSLRLFTWPGVTVLPEDSYCDSCDYREVAIGIVRDVSAAPPEDPNASGPPDGKFADNDDAFYFFAQGPDGWESDMDESRPDTNFTTHPYEKNNFYYLTVATRDRPVSGDRYPVPQQRIGTGTGTRSVALDGTETPSGTVPGRVHLEHDFEYWPDASAFGSTLKWEKWFWRSLLSGQSFTDRLDLPDADTTQPARFRLRQWGLSDNYVGFDISCRSGAPDHLLDCAFNSVAFPTRSWFGTAADQRAGVTFDTTGVFLRHTGNQLTVTVPRPPFDANCPFRLDRSGLAFYEVYYERNLIPVAEGIDFRTHPVPGRFRYDVGPFVKLPPTYLFDVTDPTRPVLLTGADTTAGGTGFTLSFGDTQTVSHRYIVVPDSILERNEALLPASAAVDAPFTSQLNLRSAVNQADYLVIYFDSFKTAADSLLAWRREHLPLMATPAPHAVMGVPVSALFDQFSGGRTDPGAIRSFLRAAAGWSVRPLYVTFLGDASFDFKDITGRATPGLPGCLLPSFENNFDNHFLIRRQYATDDWMVNVDDPVVVLPDYLTGRIPAGDAASALSVVLNKVLAYERAAPLGEYRNSVVLLADDNVQGGPCDATSCRGCDGLAWEHVRVTNDLSQSHTPSHVDREYVYLHTFPTGPSVTKPAAHAKLMQDLDGGASIFNFVGHGSPFKMTDESVFLDSDAGTITNGLKMPLLVAASCDVGKFNDPTVQSLGERVFMSPSGGCIAVVSATEQALSNLNSFLNGLMYDALFERDTLRVAGILMPTDGQYHLPVSAALLSAKSVPSLNSQKYQLMGDAATVLNLPRLWADVTLTDDQGAPLTTVARGQTVQFHGRVLDRPGGAPVALDGVASMLLEDSAPVDQTPSTCQPSISYTSSPGPMYHGDVTVSAGTFNGRFVVPLDATLGSAARARAYVSGRPAGGGPNDGAGSGAMTIGPGTPPTGDDQGPRITLEFAGGSTNVRPDATLRINLFDVHGIMTTGHALQNSIVVTLDGNTTSRTDVTSTFRYAADSYQSGMATFQLPGLSPGPHSVKVSAADNLATGIDAGLHRSAASLDFQVVNAPALRVARTFLFPNPVRSGGRGSGGVFVVDAPGDSINTMVRVYTVAGRLVRALRQMGGIGQVQVVWDGLDDEGDRLAQGTYLYKVYVSVRDPDGTSSSSQKATAEGRFVVLNP